MSLRLTGQNMRLRRLLLPLALIATLVAPRSRAANIVHFQAAAGPHNYLVTNHPAVLPHLTPSVWLLGSYGYRPLVLRDANGRTVSDVVTHAASADLAAALGLFDRFELALAVPASFVSGPGFDGGGLQVLSPGDLRVLGKVLLTPWNEGLVASLRLRADLPIAQLTGDGGRLLGENAWPNLTPAVSVGYNSEGFRLGLDLGYLIRAPSALGDLRVGHEVLYGLAGEVQVLPGTLYATADLFGRIAPSPLYELFTDEPGQDMFPLELALAAKYYLGPLALVAGAGTGIIPDYGSPQARVFAGLGYYPRPVGDRDGDGFNDDEDGCPDDPETVNGYQDSDGCPDVEPARDSDGDGIVDPEDRCPEDPETVNNYRDQDGCPDAPPAEDSDGDGIADDVDECPEDREDMDAFEDQDGCPDLDNDQDQIPDDSDECPDQPEDMDGWEDEDGCPDPDNDRDEILDDDDACPNDPEIFNDFEDEDGCPDGRKVTVVVTRERIEITDRVYFKFNSHKIKRRSFELLDQVATVISAHPEIPMISVAGHTDSVGREAYNIKLSKRRAKSVMKYLTGAGVDPARLTFEGLGPNQPIATNETAEGRAQNRRVEFRIVASNDEL